MDFELKLNTQSVGINSNSASAWNSNTGNAFVSKAKNKRTYFEGHLKKDCFKNQSRRYPHPSESSLKNYSSKEKYNSFSSYGHSNLISNSSSYGQRNEVRCFKCGKICHKGYLCWSKKKLNNGAYNEKLVAHSCEKSKMKPKTYVFTPILEQQSTCATTVNYLLS